MTERKGLALATSYAENMPGWKVEPMPDDMSHGAYLVNGDGVKLFVKHDTYRNRVEITASYPYRNNIYMPKEDAPRVEITVSAEREPASAARDILRRCVPDAEKGTRAWREAIEKADAAYAAVDAAADALTAEFPWLSASQERRGTGGRSDLRWYTTGRPHGKISLNYEGKSGAMEINGLSLAKIKRILRIVDAPN